jgi:hypothetical protein
LAGRVSSWSSRTPKWSDLAFLRPVDGTPILHTFSGTLLIALAFGPVADQHGEKLRPKATVGRVFGRESWRERSAVVRSGNPALLRISHPIELRPGERVRVLDAAVALDPESDDQPAIVTLGMFSEMFSVQ